MEQLQQVQKEQEVIAEISIGNSFSEYLISKGDKKCKNFNLVFQILSYVARDNYKISYPVIRAIEQNSDQFSPIFYKEVLCSFK